MVQRLVDSSRRRRERSKRHARLALARRPLEALEARSLLSQVFTVTNTSDNTSTGSLRWAIGQVNADATDTLDQQDQIRFAIPATDPGYSATTGVWTIAPATALPVIARAVVIDGYTQHGAAANTSATADNAVLKVELSGARASLPYGLAFVQGSDGQAVSTSGVRGLAIHSFAADVSLDVIPDNSPQHLLGRHLRPRLLPRHRRLGKGPGLGAAAGGRRDRPRRQVSLQLLHRG